MQATQLPPACCRRCRHLVTLIAGSAQRASCLKGHALSAACAWWAPRHASLHDAMNDAGHEAARYTVTAEEVAP